MKTVTPRYPVDRYLVESSKTLEMVNIIDDDIWNTEPALKPEDEIILRKLHEMLQSTADDLKLLSGELSKFHEPGVQVKSVPTPLDEEFNEKVHIEEIVNAKFHGYEIIDKSSSCKPENESRKDEMKNYIKPPSNPQKYVTNNIPVLPVNTRLLNRKPVTNRSLGISRTKIIQINGNENSTKTEKLDNGNKANIPAVAYNEYSFKYVEPKLKTPHKALNIQEMPSISIRSELKEQKVLHLDIIPEIKESEKAQMVTKNVAVVTIQHELPKTNVTVPAKQLSLKLYEVFARQQVNQPATARKISKMSTYDSSESTNNNISSDTQVKLKTQKRVLTNVRSSPKSSTRSIYRKKVTEKSSHTNQDKWRKKLNSVYGATNSKKGKFTKAKSKAIISPKKSNIPNKTPCKPNNLDNIEYIPYSKLTIGGVRASDIEREISDIPNKQDIRLNPILDKILSSRENSFSKNSPQKHTPRDRFNVFTTSDENLLQEVVDIEKTISETLSKNNINAYNDKKIQSNTSDSDRVKDNDSYADDFEDEKSDLSDQSENYERNMPRSNGDDKSSDEQNNISNDGGDNNGHESKSDVKRVPSASNTNIHNLTYNKISNLSYKDTVDIFEFVHSVDTQDSATQSITGQKKCLQETQTSPTTERNIQPIHNDLWPSIDPKGDVEKMFQIEKEFIKNLIVEEYGDLIEKSIEKPSTSKIETRRNVAASQKNTQTSPAHVKNVMTSPTRTKTRTTSPFARLSVDHHTSPLIFVSSNEDEIKLEIENKDDPGISINLSSPRFSLRLPQTSRDVLSNLGDSEPRPLWNNASNITNVRYKNKSNITVTSTSSLEADSSEISSLGEVKLRRKLGHIRIFSDTESVTSSSTSDFQSGILPLRSEGELSLNRRKKSNKQNKSEGEASLGLL